MKNRLNKLLTIKSIVTIVLTVVFAALSACGEISAELFLSVYVVIIGFYFGTQFDKNKNNK